MNELELIEKIKGEHNGIIDELARSSESLKSQCEDIDEELEVHDYLLGRIEDLTQANEELLDTVRNKLEKALEKYSNSSLMCTIFILIVVLVLVIVL